MDRVRSAVARISGASSLDNRRATDRRDTRIPASARHTRAIELVRKGKKNPQTNESSVCDCLSFHSGDDGASAKIRAFRARLDFRSCRNRDGELRDSGKHRVGFRMVYWVAGNERLE